MLSVEIVKANLHNSSHQKAVLDLVDAYARDPMGDGKPLSEQVRQRLIPELQKHPTTLIFLAYQQNQAIGIAVCFIGFSTFRAKPLLNIHDIAVLPESRGQKVGQQLLNAVEQEASHMGCCKLTLEVQEYNHRARHVYESVGFRQAEPQNNAGGSLFYAKSL